MIRHSIEVWILSAHEVLLLHVPERIGNPAFWQPVTGGIESGESAPVAAVREVWEETGYHIQESDLRPIAEGIEVVVNDSLRIQKSLYSVEFPRIPVVTSPQEHDAHRWVRNEQVAGLLYWPSNKHTWQLVQSRTNSTDS